MGDLDEMLKAAGICDEEGGYVDPEVFRSGFVTFVGRPNAGKSTLLNAVMGQKVAITSRTPQTTRHRFRAVYDTDEMQLVMVDTPGLHKPGDTLGEQLNESALQALADVDVVAMLVDASAPIGRGDEWVARQLEGHSCKKVLVISKTDLVKKAVVREQLKAGKQLAAFDESICLSARQRVGVDEFVQLLYSLLPNGPRWFPKGTGLDQPDEVIIAEFVREKILRSTFDEVPHSVGVVVEQLERDPKSGFMKVWAVVYVERKSQKGIIIGHGGSKIKQVGTQARADLERLFGVHMHIDITVKVKKDWRNDASQIRKFGYGEGL